MSSHSATVGGSTAGRLLQCPGWRDLATQVPEAPSSQFAAEGSMLHDAMELILNGAEPPTLLGHNSHGHTLTQDHMDGAVLPALTWFDGLCDTFGIEWYAAETKADWASQIPGAFGTIDVLGGGAHNLVLDWKFGRGVAVSAKDNAQLMFYAAGAMLSDKDFDHDKPTVLAVCQPYRDNSYHIVKTAELELFITQIQTALPKRHIATGKYCKFCPAEPVCPEKNRKAREVQAGTYDTAAMPLQLELAEEMAAWADSVRAFGHTILSGGGHIKGYKLVQKRAVARWEDEAAATKRIRSLKLLVRDTTVRKLRTPGQVQALLVKQGRDPDLLSACIDKRSSGTNLVREDDKRPAVPALGNLKR